MSGIRWTVAVTGVMLGAGLVAGCGGGSSHQTATSAASTKPAARPQLVAVLRAPGHKPRLKAAWRITVTLDWGGHPARGHVSYQFLFGGHVVSQQPVRGESANFTGVFHDKIQWPATAVGFPLTFRVVVSSAHGTKRLDYPVQVSR